MPIEGFQGNASGDRDEGEEEGNGTAVSDDEGKNT